MSLTAQFVDGKLLTQPNQEQTSKSAKVTDNKATKTTGSSSLDKDAFLQLLVAQMKYQDPMEPTSNTEYISQYATFSELEQMQNVSANTTLARATEMVGKEVIMEAKESNGDTKMVQGYVEKVVYNGTKAYLVIDGSQYSIDDLKQVIDDEYKQGEDTVERINKTLEKLPKLENLTIAQASDVINMYNDYMSLSEHQRQLLNKDTEDLINQYVSKMNDIIEEAGEAAKQAAEETEKSEEPSDGSVDEAMEDAPTEEV